MAIKIKGIFLLRTIAGTLVLLSAGCTTTGPGSTNVRLLVPGNPKSGRPGKDNENFYEPPRSPQFNTARDE